jgi:hypothetical protein
MENCSERWRDLGLHLDHLGQALLVLLADFNITLSKDESEPYPQTGKLPRRSDDIWFGQCEDVPLDRFKSVDLERPKNLSLYVIKL